MVKFTKQFEGQLVPEWKEAFVDYWQLKKDIKKIHCESISSSKPKQKSSLRNTLFSSFQKLSLFGNQQDREVIHVQKSLSNCFYSLNFELFILIPSQGPLCLGW